MTNENSTDINESKFEIKVSYEKEIKQLEAVIIDLKNQIELTKKTSKNKLKTVGTTYKVSYFINQSFLKLNFIEFNSEYLYSYWDNKN